MIWVGEIEHGSSEYREAVAFRRRLLREPLGLDFTAGELDGEASQRHLVLRRDGTIIGTLLLVPPSEGAAKLRQMAIEPSLRLRGLGALLARHGERHAIRLGATAIFLHARLGAVAFYCRLGYRTAGEPFLEVTIPHLRMDKQLEPSDMQS